MQLKEQLPGAKKIILKTGMISLPKELMDLQRLFQQEEVPNFSEISHIIGQNVELAGEVVKTANLPSMQGNIYREILSIPDAVEVIGARRLQNLVKAISLKLAVSSMGGQNILKHSLAVAELSAKLAKLTKIVPADEAYLLGLFHNLGAIMMVKYDTSYNDIFNKSLSAPYSSLALEYQTYQTSHPVVGLLVAENWELSDVFKKVLVMHHEQKLKVIRNKPLKKLVGLIQLANAMVAVKDYAIYKTPEWQTQFQSTLDVLALEEEALSELWR